MQNLRDSTFPDVTLKLITVANSCRRSDRIKMQSVSKLFPCLLYPSKCPTTIVPFDSNGGREKCSEVGGFTGFVMMLRMTLYSASLHPLHTAYGSLRHPTHLICKNNAKTS